ncbi:NAD(P)/FAD-dependent oxidoreductase [Pollutibacter soli]|uniref:phytoene desaturase family protein n=1 Tax=Pollutibacter soli TaxID=3034157 RepID=UPI0030138554
MKKEKKDFDAIVVGSGPNGLAAAITIQQQGLSVLLIEGKDQIGGGMRTAELTLPGFKHDVCSAIHPMAAGSPFFKTLPLHEFGLEWIYPPVAAAHPLDNGEAAILTHHIFDTAEQLGSDAAAYKNLIGPILKNWPAFVKDLLAPLHFPGKPFAMAGFGLKGLQSAKLLSRTFKTEKAKALFAGMAAHSILPLDKMASAAIGLVLMTAAHADGWPIPGGGSQSLANALADYFVSIGGQIETGNMISSLYQLPSSRAVLLDVTPRQLLKIAGQKFSTIYRSQLSRYRYGMGVFKIDWALDSPIPFTAKDCSKAGTVHIGGTWNEIAHSEQQSWKGIHSRKPFVLLAQQSVFDKTRAPSGKHTAWAYCHVPSGSDKNMTDIIEQQVERFAPGFRDLISGRHTMNSKELEQYNPNYIGGDINGGAAIISQLFTRPALRYSPYRTSAKGIYVCSSSTPPGGGVHGMNGWHAAKRALKDIFKINLPPV